MTVLVGKYFIGVHDGGVRSGIVEAAIDATHYLVRFDDSPCVAMVPVSDMFWGGMDKDEPRPWAFFDDQEQRARYDEWTNEPSNYQGSATIGWLNRKG
jgi:hypothetical protein